MIPLDRDALERRLRPAEESAFEEQVLGRIAGQRQLREDDELRAGVTRLGRELLDFAALPSMSPTTAFIWASAMRSSSAMHQGYGRAGSGNRPRGVVEFVRVDRVPLAGEIVEGSAFLEEPAGGGAVAAVQMARLAGACDFFTALGDDALARRSIARLSALGVTVHAAKRPEPTRRGWVYADVQGERTITVIGKKLVPALDDPAVVGRPRRGGRLFFVAGGEGCSSARGRRSFLGATTRSLPPGPGVAARRRHRLAATTSPRRSRPAT